MRMSDWSSDVCSSDLKRGERDGHRILDGRLRAAEAGAELVEQRRADADDDGEHQHLDAGGNYQPQHALGHEGGLAKQAKRDQHEHCERSTLELAQGEEKRDREKQRKSVVRGKSE